MPYIFLAAIAIVLLLVGVNWASNADAASVRRIGRYVVAMLMGIGAVLLASRGAFALAGPLAFGAFAVATGLRIPGLAAIGLGGASSTPGQSSQVETAYLRIVLDHDSGGMDGEILQGPMAGQRLSDLDRGQLSELLSTLEEHDPDGARLLNAYLARRFQGEWQEDETVGNSSTADSPMSRDNAYEILGLSPDASTGEIKAAHRRLMKKFHPDQGGSTFFASKLNQAKDKLLG